MVAGSARVRSGLIFRHDVPSSVDFHTCWEPTYSASGSTSDTAIGYVQFQRSGMSRAGSPMTIRGYGWMSRTMPVARSYRVSAFVAPA